MAPEISAPLFFHWYAGVVPPLNGEAVKVTEVPAQIDPEGTAAIVTFAGSKGLTVMGMPAEVAGEPVKHGAAFDVITTAITSPSARVVEV